MRTTGPSAVLLGLALGLGACGAPVGPDLPSTLGTTVRAGDGPRPGETPEEPPPEPPALGDVCWAAEGRSGFYRRGVVIAIEEERIRVVYADGHDAWVMPHDLRPDHVGPGTVVRIRLTLGGPHDRTGTVVRRLGDAFYVRMASGEERWVSVAFVAAVDLPREAPAAVDVPEAGEGIGDLVLVDYQLGGLGFLATVTGREEHRVHVVYLDGEAAWVDVVQVDERALRSGEEVHVRRRWEPAEWLRGRLDRQFGDAVRVVFVDGGFAWTSRLRLRVPLANRGEPGAEPAADE